MRRSKKKKYAVRRRRRTTKPKRRARRSKRRVTKRSKTSMAFIRSQGFKSRSAYEAALQNIARVNESFFRGPELA